jgi:hypothetical protein
MSETQSGIENEQPPSTPQLCMGTVRDYGNDEISKVAAVKAILAAFTESSEYDNTPQDKLDSVIGTYIQMLDQHDNSRRIAAGRGRESGGPYRDDDRDLEDQASVTGSKRRYAESPGPPTASKKKTPDETLFAWLDGDTVDNVQLSRSQDLTRKLVQNHTLDIKATKLKVLSAKRVPEFPDSEWNNLLSNKAVNIDTVFSGMYSTDNDNRAVENIGDLELHFGAAKPSKAVETHGDWVIAWKIIFRATRFIFLHREAELDDYNDYITSYFASIHKFSLEGSQPQQGHLQTCWGSQ